MMKKIFEKYFPTRESLLKTKSLKLLHRFFDDPNLWHLNCHSVATAASIGCFVAFLPFPGHMIMAALLAIAFQANLPIAVAMVWVSNPFTIPPMFYLAYRVGIYVLGRTSADAVHHFPESYTALIHDFNYFAFPILIGALICGALLAIIANACVRLFYLFR